MFHRLAGRLVCALSLLAACGGEVSEYPGDVIEAIRSECVDHQASSKVCEGSCITARLNAPCPESDELWGSEEMDVYLDCVDSCAVESTCTDGRVLKDCDC